MDFSVASYIPIKFKLYNTIAYGFYTYVFFLYVPTYLINYTVNYEL